MIMMLIILPRISNIFMQTPGAIRSPALIIKARITSGILLMRSVIMGTPATIPPTKQPTGIVTIPQRNPKRTSLWYYLLTALSPNGMVNEMVQPIIDDTTSPL